MSLPPGTRLGPYEVLAALGAGGMGEVYKARDSRLDRLFAVKILSPAMAVSPNARERFEREARAISRLSHPHVCALFDVGRDGDTLYLVMELIEGETLRALVAKGPLPMSEVLRIGGQIAEALAAALEGIAHRVGRNLTVLLECGVADAGDASNPLTRRRLGVLVDQNSASWNRIAGWLKALHAFQKAN